MDKICSRARQLAEERVIDAQRRQRALATALAALLNAPDEPVAHPARPDARRGLERLGDGTPYIRPGDAERMAQIRQHQEEVYMQHQFADAIGLDFRDADVVKHAGCGL